MKIRILLAVLCGVMLILIVPASLVCAESYVSGHIGYVVTEDSHTRFDEGLRADVAFDDGVSFTAAIGGRIYKYFRVEQELSYLEQDVDKIKVSGAPSLRVRGDATAWTLLGNVYYDFLNSSPVTPYLSAGIGLADVEISSLRSTRGGGFYQKGDSDVVFAYQLGAGIGYQVSPGIVLDVKYRFFAMSEPEFKKARSEFSSHHFYAGARFFFRY